MSKPAKSPVKSPDPRPKLMLFGDPHGDFRFPIASVQRHVPEAVTPGKAS